MLMKRITPVLFLLAAAIMVSATCPFLTVDVQENVAVNRSVRGVFTIALKNTGSASQNINVNALCDGSIVRCEFPDLPTPLSLAAQATAVVHLEVPTEKLAAGNYSVPIQAWSGFTNQCLEQRNTVLTVRDNGTAASGVQATTAIFPSGDVTARPGETISFTITVANNKPETQHFSVLYGSSEGNPFAENTFVSPSEFSLEAQQTKLVEAKIIIPVGTPALLKQFSFRVKATTAGAQQASYDLPIKLFVYSGTLNLQLDGQPSQCVQAFHNQQITRTLNVRNLGDVAGPFDASIVALPEAASFMQLDKTLLELSRGELQQLKIIASPLPSVKPARYAFTLLVSYDGLNAVAYDSCVDVYGVSGTNALSQQEFSAPRGMITTIPFIVENNGSLQSNYSVSYSPNPFNGITLAVSPNSFTLAPGEKKEAAITIAAASSAELGAKQTHLTLYSSTQQQDVLLKLRVVSANSSDSPLAVRAASFNALAGKQSQSTVRVKNNGQLAISNVELVIEGIPSAWYGVQKTSETIPAGATKDFLVTFTVPAGNEGEYPVFVAAFSGLESTKTISSLAVEEPRATIAMSIVNVTKRNEEIFVRIVVRNNGNVPLSQVAASIPESPEFVVTQEKSVSLQPGGEAFVDVRVVPTDNTQSRDVFIRLASPEGAQQFQAVRLPELKASAEEGGDAWKIVAIILLIVGILVLVSREEVDDLLKRK